jgi:hypothetical protein
MNEFQLLKKHNNELRELAVQQMVGGNVQNIEAYRELVGFIRGLDRANLNISDLEQRMEQNLDE